MRVSNTTAESRIAILCAGTVMLIVAPLYAEPAAIKSIANPSTATASLSWHAKCHDPREVDYKIINYHDDSLQGVFCDSVADRLGLSKGLTQEACHQLKGKLNDDGWCKIVLDFYDLIKEKSLFCRGVPKGSAVIVRILIQERTNSDHQIIYNYEWNIIGREKCSIWKATHNVNEGISSSIDHELHGGNEDDPSILRSTKSLQTLYLASWKMLMSEQSMIDWNCIIHPKDE